jgi:type I restriction enzyme S subunit
MRPYLRAANVTWQGLDLTDVKQMDFTATESKTYELRPDDLLLAEASGSPGEVGKPAKYSGQIDECCFQNTLLRVRLPDGLRPDFYEHFFREQARNGRFAAGSRGVGIHHLGAGALSDWQIPVPPEAEQEQIVVAIEEAFSKLDAGEAGLRTVRQLLTRMREALLTTAVTGRLVPQDSTDTPAAKLLANLGIEPTRSTGDLPVLPATWEWTTLGEFADVVGGVTKDVKRQDDPAFVEVPYLRVANVQRGFLDLQRVATIRVAPAKAKQLELLPGDVLFNEGGDRDKLGRGWVWTGEIPGCIHQNHVFRARLPSGIEPKLVSWWGNTFGQSWFEGRGRQTTNLASLNLTTLKSFPLPIAPPEEQKRIVAEIERQLSFVEAC